MSAVSKQPQTPQNLPSIYKTVANAGNQNKSKSPLKKPKESADSRIPLKLANVTDCNELKNELLILLRQEKEMEFKLKREKQRQDQIGKQLVKESERPNEDIQAQKNAARQNLEKQIEKMQQKLDGVQFINVEQYVQQIDKEYTEDSEFYEFCANLPLIRNLVQYLMAEVELQHKQNGLVANQQFKSKKNYQMISQVIEKDLSKEYAEILSNYNKAFEVRTNRMCYLNQQLSDGFNLEESIISENYQQRLNDVDMRMQKEDLKYQSYLKEQGFDVQEQTTGASQLQNYQEINQANANTQNEQVEQNQQNDEQNDFDDTHGDGEDNKLKQYQVLAPQFF